METKKTSATQEAISLNSSIPAEQLELELYTIPSTSAWFDWSGIHEIEREALKEFFDATSYTRTPKVYREYRDFMINKFREEPTRRLRFTEVRKALVGDVSLLRKLFEFLEEWGLINFGVEDVEIGDVRRGEEKVEVRVEEGAPVGVRVVAVPGTGKGVSESIGSGVGGLVDGEFKFPPLASYSDVFEGLVKRGQEVVVCASCGGECGSVSYTSKKGKEVICEKCFESNSFREGNTIENFKSDGGVEVLWTEEETLLLLQSVVKHSDDWELISQTVKTKSKLDCIAKLITLPLGDFVLGSDHGLISPGNYSECGVRDIQTPSSKPVKVVKSEDMAHNANKPMQSSKPGETIKSEDVASEATKPMQNGDTDHDGPPLKKMCIDRSSIMKQVAVISSMVSQHITGAAAEAAVAALWDENPDIKEVFDIDDEYTISDSGAATSALEAEDSEMKDAHISSKTCDTSQESSLIPLALRYRAATATALGAAAARAKMLADQEDRELEYLMATIIENQLKKLQCKMKVLDDVQQIMETECAFIAEQEESIISERMDILKRAIDLGITRLRDVPTVKSQSNVVL